MLGLIWLSLHLHFLLFHGSASTCPADVTCPSGWLYRNQADYEAPHVRLRLLYLQPRRPHQRWHVVIPPAALACCCHCRRCNILNARKKEQQEALLIIGLRDVLEAGVPT